MPKYWPVFKLNVTQEVRTVLSPLFGNSFQFYFSAIALFGHVAALSFQKKTKKNKKQTHSSSFPEVEFYVEPLKACSNSPSLFLQFFRRWLRRFGAEIQEMDLHLVTVCPVSSAICYYPASACCTVYRTPWLRPGHMRSPLLLSWNCSYMNGSYELWQ